MVTDLMSGLTKVTEIETGQWIAEFNNSVAALRQQASPGVSSPQDLITWSRKGDVTPWPRAFGAA